MNEQEIKNSLPAASNVPYLVAVVIMMLIAIGSITSIAILRPGADNSNLYVLIVGSTGPTTLALLAFMKAQETHLAVNSRLEQFIRNAGRAERSEGEMAGRLQGRTEAKQTFIDAKEAITAVPQAVVVSKPVLDELKISIKTADAPKDPKP